MGSIHGPLRALVFDSTYDQYKGVVAYVRVFDGSLKDRNRLKLMASGYEAEVLEVGTFRPTLTRLPWTGNR